MSAITLDGFCHHLVNGRGPYGRLYPAPLAGEFVDFFGLSAFPRMEEIKTLLERHDVATVVLSHDTRGFRGYHIGEKWGVYRITLGASESMSVVSITCQMRPSRRFTSSSSSSMTFSR